MSIYVKSHTELVSLILYKQACIPNETIVLSMLLQIIKKVNCSSGAPSDRYITF